MVKLIYQICLVVSSLALFTLAEPMFGGDNVCNKTITVRRDKTVEVPVKYELEYSGICHGILPCTKTRTVTRMDSKLKTTLEEMNVAVCCPGYAEDPSRECLPICLKSCNHGTCVAPGQCKCQPEPTEISPGFVGSSCNRFACLASNRWGSACQRECNCPQNSYCSASTGKCICRAGWRGSNCTEECDSMMSCDEVELPPIVDPDSNIISESSKIEALAPRALLREYETTSEDQNEAAGAFDRGFLMSAHLCYLTLVCILAFFLYRKYRPSTIRNENIYYSTSSGSSSSSSGSGSPYYSSATNSSVQKRPMPTPPVDSLYNKNLNFDSATRFLLKDGNPSAGKLSNEIKADSRLEEHLIASQKSAKQNLYSDIELGSGDRSVVAPANQSSVSIDMDRDRNVLHVNITTGPEDSTSHYQVPKSPAIRAHQAPSVAEVAPEIYAVYSNEDENLYEEIKPRPPSSSS